ncbi:hypothetical protein D3C78_1173010 [compost metagenome]
MRTKALNNLRLEQHLEQVVDRQRCPFVHPAKRQQGLGGFGTVADLGVPQLAEAKMQPLAHDHTDQQCLGGTGQAAEIGNELLLLPVEHVDIALLEPGEHSLKVVQVVEGIIERIECHKESAMPCRYWLCVQIPAWHRCWQTEKDQWRSFERLSTLHRVYA